MIRLMLVDDHPVVMGGLEAALEGHSDLEVVGQATSLAEAHAILQVLQVDVALVDIRLPDGSGLELLDAASSPAQPAILMLTTFSSPQYVATAMRLGARGFLLKTAPIEEIVAGVRTVAAGGIVVHVDSEVDASPPLTPREREIIAGVIDGETNKGIAHRLGISQKTVEWHLARLFERLRVDSRGALAVQAVRGEWLERGI